MLDQPFSHELRNDEDLCCFPEKRPIRISLSVPGWLVKRIIAMKIDEQRHAYVPGDRKHLRSHWAKLSQHQLDPSTLEIGGNAVGNKVLVFQLKNRFQEQSHGLQTTSTGEEVPALVIVKWQLPSIQVVDVVIDEGNQLIDKGFCVFRAVDIYHGDVGPRAISCRDRLRGTAAIVLQLLCLEHILEEHDWVTHQHQHRRPGQLAHCWINLWSKVCAAKQQKVGQEQYGEPGILGDEKHQGNEWHDVLIEGIQRRPGKAISQD